MSRKGKKLVHDIFANWKKQRFIVADEDVISDYRSPTEDLFFGAKKFKYLIVMTDIAYFAENMDEVDKWCEQHDCTISGMTVEVPSDEALMMFTLRWS